MTRRTPAAQIGAQRPSASDLAPRQTERQWQTTVVAYAALRGFRAYHTHLSIRSQPGWPDLVLIKRPRVLFVELKSDTGRVTAEQQWWLDELLGCGQEVHVWRPSMWDEVVEVLA